MIVARLGVIFKAFDKDGIQKQYASEVVFDKVPTKEEVLEAVALVAEQEYGVYEKEKEAK